MLDSNEIGTNHIVDPANGELTGRFSVITAAGQPVIAEVLQVERLVPEAQSAEEPSGRPGTGQLAIPGARSAAGTAGVTSKALALS